jgi:hydroxymethylpyrimidine pyrophosphatase-like HAD family hydrolase
MKLFAVAVDFDGTIAFNDRVDPGIRDAIGELRARGVLVLLVTGRILDDLTRVAGDLHFVDAVIAENGAVLYFPESDHTTVLAPPVPQPFVDQLRERGLSIHAGRSLVDAAAADAPALLDAIRSLELPLVLIFNKGRVMAMPQGVSKGTGLRVALDTLRVSARNTVAIGDAENDHELLRLAEVGAAVPWASPALRTLADVTLPGEGAAAVRNAIVELRRRVELPDVPRPRRRLLLGHTEDGREFSLAARGRNVLIAGDTKSGKSWVAGLLCEQLILHGYCVAVLDPEGDYRSLEALPGVTVLGGDDPPPTPRQLMRALRYPDRSVVIDLSRQTQEAKRAYIRAALPALNVLREHTGLPHRIVLDEAHYFLHEKDAGLLDLERNGYTLISYLSSRLPAAFIEATTVMIATCESNPAEIEELRRRCVSCRSVHDDEWKGLCRLRPGQAMVLPVTRESEGRLRLVNVARRLTPHVRHRQKYVDVPVAESQAFVFGANGASAPARVRTLREFVHHLEHAGRPAIEPYAMRSDFSRWIRDVFGDFSLANELRALEAQTRAAPGSDTVAGIADAIRSRYDLVEEPLVPAG